MIDPVTQWLKIAQIEQKDAYMVADVVERTWLMRYPWPATVILDQGTEFLLELAEMIQNDFSVRKRLSQPEIWKQTQLLSACIK